MDSTDFVFDLLLFCLLSRYVLMPIAKCIMDECKEWVVCSIIDPYVISLFTLQLFLKVFGIHIC